MQRTTPPFRADQVGSLLRSKPLKEARAKREAGEISAADLTAVEDAEIRKLVAKQEEVGLQAVTDGEYRRSWWHFDFLTQLDGVDLVVGEKTIQFHNVQTKAHSLNISGKIGFGDQSFVDHFKFLKANTNVVAKMTIPSPSVLHFRLGRNSISRDLYPNLDDFFADTADAYRKAVNAFADAGCKYLQFDDTVWAYLCSAEQCEQARQRGDDPEALPKIYADMINHALAERPSDMAITMHVCRGNFRSSWISEGGYEPVAEVMFNDVNIDGFFLEYDTDRAAPVCAQGRQAGRSRPDHVEERNAGKQGRRQEAHRGGDPVCRPRSVLPQPAVRLRLDRGGQHPYRGAAMGEAADDRRDLQGSLGVRHGWGLFEPR